MILYSLLHSRLADNFPLFILVICCCLDANKQGICLALSNTSGGGGGNGVSITSRTNPCECVAEVDCAIIGGGPAGLITSIALTKSSPSSSIAIFEKDNLEPKGASVQISKKGWQSIEKIDASLVKKLESTGVPVTDVETKPWKYEPMKILLDEEEKGKMRKRDRFRKAIEKQLQTGKNKLFPILLKAAVQRVHRWHDVRMTLKDYAVELYNAKEKNDESLPSLMNTNCLLTDCQVMEDAVESSHRFELTFRNTGAVATTSSSSSQTEEFKVRSKYLFACDGTKSVVRAILPREPDVLLAENKSVWRGMAPNINVKGKATFYRGLANDDTAGRSALTFPGGKNIGCSWTVISDIVDGKSESLEEAKVRVLKVLETMNENEEIEEEKGSTKSRTNNPEYDVWMKIIQDTEVVIENKLHVRDFDQPWESAYDGLVYIGDAAHPVRPTGQGLALAFEDAQVLGEVIAKQRANQGIVSDEALREFENERYLPVKAISEKIRSTAEGFYKK